jgi:3-deoxy-7-phosphoheptulonate synthase
MILEIDNTIGSEGLSNIRNAIENAGYSSRVIRGKDEIVLGIRGRPISQSLEEQLRHMPGILNVTRITEAYKEVSRRFHPADTVIELSNGAKIGDGHFALIAGPCSVEDYATTLEAANWAKEAGAAALRGGVFKPRTNPYSFQGLGEKGLEILARVKEETGLPIVTEILEPEDESVSLGGIIKLFEKYDVDIYQIGARSAQNFPLLYSLSKRKHPVLYKNGIGMNAEEFLQGAEYLLSGVWGESHNGGGNPNVILCARGVNTGDISVSRYPLDISLVPELRMKTHLPVIADPSHSTGKWYNVVKASLGLIAAGAQGLEVEVHPNPQQAKSDGKQAIGLEHLMQISKQGRAIFGITNSIPLEAVATAYYK